VSERKGSAQAWIWRCWRSRGIVSTLLLPLAWVYRGLLALNLALRRSGLLATRRLPVPVIVIGNFTVGGAGKTPLALWLVERLREGGRAPGIVSRGYGGSAHGPLEVDADSDPALSGDEPVLLAASASCPVWVGRDRYRAGLALLAAHPQTDVIVLDDGLQHRSLARDIEIVVHDERGEGNGRLLPAGPLRERPRPVDARVCNAEGCPPGEFAMRLEPAGLVGLHDGEPVAVQALLGRKTQAAAGIGNPDRFFASLRAMGLAPRTRALPDHHRWRPADLDPSAGEVLIVTAKDAVKLRRLQPVPGLQVIVLEVRACVDDALAARVLETLTHGRPMPGRADSVSSQQESMP
jgi:tetraacyldisaccharide 4'-kinase